VQDKFVVLPKENRNGLPTGLVIQGFGKRRTAARGQVI